MLPGSSTGWTWYWAIWFLVTFPVAFLVPELYAIFSGHPENTLSNQVWKIETFMPGQSIVNWTAMHVLVGGVLALVLLWLVGHFTFGLWR
jgi:hypothetical protein